MAAISMDVVVEVRCYGIVTRGNTNFSLEMRS